MSSLKSDLAFVQMLIDKIAIGAAVLCALHCTVLPIVLISLPTVFSFPVDDHHFHQLLVWFIAPISIVGVLLGCTRHKDTLVASGIGGGLLLVIGAAAFGHDFLGEWGEKLVTITGSVLLAAAHYRNFKLCREQQCSDNC